MTDSRDELRSALESQQVRDDEAASGQRDLDDERRAYEQNEAATISRLQEMAALTLAELNKKAPARPVPLNPSTSGLSSLLGAKTVVGWEISLECYQSRLDRHVLCPDGRLLIRPEEKRHSKMPPLPYTTLSGWVEEKLRGARKSGFGAAFRFDPTRQSKFVRFSGGPKEKLLQALASQELLVKNALVRILRSQGIAELT
jgi:hypothetical protein